MSPLTPTTGRFGAQPSRGLSSPFELQSEAESASPRVTKASRFKEAVLLPRLPKRDYTSLCKTLAVFVAGFLFSLLFKHDRPTIYDATTLVKSSKLSRPIPAATMAALRSNASLPDSLARHLGLSYAECDAGFPLLWPELQQTKEAFLRPRDGQVGVTQRDLDRVEDMDGTRVAIIDGQMYVKRFHPESKTRNQAVLASLYSAVITSPEPLPDVEFWFRATDSLDQGGWWALNKRPGELLWLLPDFGLWSWPEPGVKGWVDYRRKVQEVESRITWRQKANKLFFRGAFLSLLRNELHALASQHPWGDVANLDWGNLENRVEMEDHCKHRWLASIEGAWAYSGRLKYLLQCRSVVVSHAMQFTQHFHGALVTSGPDQNIVELPNNNWDGLPETMDHLLRDDAFAQNIADNAVRTMRDRYLTPAATTCYWRRALIEYAGLMQFTPEIGNGVDYESFAMLEQVSWSPN